MRTKQDPRACLTAAPTSLRFRSGRGVPETAACTSFSVNDEVGGMTQFSKRGVWSSDNWMGGDE